MTNRNTRLFAAVIALVGAVSLALQLYFLLIDLQAEGMSAAGAVWRYLGYFTILTNLLVLAVMLKIATGHSISASLAAFLTLNILIVGVIYHLLLASQYDPQGWRMVADQGVHTVVPLLTLLLWLFALPKADLGLSDVPKWLVWPIGYGVYAIVRAQFDGWYPYPFIDVADLGAARVALNMLGLAAAFALSGGAMVLLGRRLPLPRASA